MLDSYSKGSSKSNVVVILQYTVVILQCTETTTTLSYQLRRIHAHPPPKKKQVLDFYSKGRSKSNADSAAEEAAQRLWRYRQPLAFGAHQVAPDGRLLACDDVSMQLYRQNDGLSEEGLMRHVSFCFFYDEKIIPILNKT